MLIIHSVLLSELRDILSYCLHMHLYDEKTGEQNNRGESEESAQHFNLEVSFALEFQHVLVPEASIYLLHFTLKLSCGLKLEPCC